MSRNDLRSAAFCRLVSPSMGGLDGEPQGSPVRFPGLPTCSVPPTRLEAGVRIANLNESEHTMTILTLGTSAIRELNGLYSLNDIHLASGGHPNQKPSEWLRNQQTQDLLAEIQKAGFPAITSKQKIGTYACRELVIAYAAWINPEFHLKVIRVFLNQTAQSSIQAPSIVDRRWLISFRDGREIIEPIKLDERLMKWSEIPHLIEARDNPLPADLVLNIGRACLNRLCSKLGIPKTA